MSNRYLTLDGTKKISETYQLILEAFDKVRGEMEAIKDKIDSHIASNTAHTAENITYKGEVPANNIRQALDSLDTRIDNIVAQSGDDNTENVDARGGFPALSARLDAFDEDLKNAPKKAMAP